MVYFSNALKTILVIVLIATSSLSFSQGKIEWMKWEDAVKASETKPKKIFMDVYTDWCGWCKKMDASTFTHPRIAELMNKYFYAVKFDAEGNEVINHLGVEYKNPNESTRRSTHTFAPFILKNKLSYPTVVMLGEQLQSYGPIPGYQSAKALEPMLIFIGEEHFKTQKWDSFLANFKSEIK